LETWRFSFAGIPKHTVVAIGAVVSGLRKLENRPLFDDGLSAMIEALKPTVVIVYGSANIESIKRLKDLSIKVLQFDSDMSKSFGKRASNE
ncbi:MAG: DUF4417 domain-containing protein, partial [Eggerthellaceae bacterium]|nr:DUF4417 domain-containing protein [Eggerthellaceae bacterium]